MLPKNMHCSSKKWGNYKSCKVVNDRSKILLFFLIRIKHSLNEVRLLQCCLAASLTVVYVNEDFEALRFGSLFTTT